MYSLGQLLSGIRSPRRAYLEVNKLYNRRLRGRTGIRILDQEWDNLIILDACRYDLFEKHNPLSGNLERVVSKGSQTVEFLRANFPGDEYGSIVYVSANPNIVHLDTRFHARVDLWESHWEEELNVVPPASVTNEAQRIADKYPNKRLIVHYMQPHFPFIGQLGRQLVESGRLEDKRNGHEFWRQIQSIGQDEFERAYVENLELVFPHVERLLNDLSGLSVVTSDHGNALGEAGVFGHPAGVYLDALVEVPWLRLPFEERRDIVSGQATDGQGISSDDVTRDRLAKLGYMDS